MSFEFERFLPTIEIEPVVAGVFDQLVGTALRAMKWFTAATSHGRFLRSCTSPLALMPGGELQFDGRRCAYREPDGTLTEADDATSGCDWP